jgi:hypothetical protein
MVEKPRHFRCKCGKIEVDTYSEIVVTGCCGAGAVCSAQEGE